MSLPEFRLRVAIVTSRDVLADDVRGDADFEVAEVAARPEELGDGVDAVLVDARLDLDAALRRLRATQPDAPVVAVGVASDAAHRAHRLGYDGVFPSEVPTAGRLGGVVRRALASRELERSELIAALAANQDAAAATDASLRALVDAHADGILVVDHDGTIRFANPAARVLLGEGGGSLEGTHFGLPLSGATVQDVDLLVGGRPLVAELRTVGITWDGVPTVLCQLRDVTERRRQETELRRVSMALDAVVETIPDAVVELDAQRRVRRWSPGAHDLLGWTEGEALGQRCPFLDDEALDRLTDEPGNETLEAIARDGARRRVLLTSRRLIDGRVLFVLAPAPGQPR